MRITAAKIISVVISLIVTFFMFSALVLAILISDCLRIFFNLLKKKHYPTGENQKKKKAVYIFVYFPFYAFTFVCSEIQRLKQAGVEVEIYVLAKGNRRDLHGDYQGLWDNIIEVGGNTSFKKYFSYLYFRLLHPFRVRRLKNKIKDSAVDKGNFFLTPYLSDAFRIARLIQKRGGTNYIHSHFTFRDSTLAYIASELLKIPRGFTSHADCFVPHKYKLLKQQVIDSAVVFTSTKQAKDHILKQCMSEGAEIGDRIGKKIVYKPGGINLEKFVFQNSDRNIRKLISISRFDHKKGIIYLVKACHLLIKKGIEIECTLVGDAPPNKASQDYYKEIINYIDSHKINSFFHFTGSLTQEEYIEHLKQNAILVAPYVTTEKGERDGVPTVLIEAMAVGTGVVATDSGAITELVRHGVNGIVVEQRNEHAIAEAIETLMNDGVLYEKLRVNARAAVEAQRDLKNTEQIFVDHVFQILNETG